MKKFLSAVGLALALLLATAPRTALGQTTKPAAAKAEAGLSQKHLDALQVIKDLPPGSDIDIMVEEGTEGSSKLVENGQSRGAGALVEGDKMEAGFNGTPNEVNLGEGMSAKGGGSRSKFELSAFMGTGPHPWQNPLFWIGLAMIGGGAFLVIKVPRVKKTGMAIAVGGVCALAAAFFPSLIAIAAGVALLVILGPTILAKLREVKLEDTTVKTEEVKVSYEESLRALLASIFDTSTPKEVRDGILARIRNHADERDLKIIRAVMQRDDLGTF